MKLTIVLLFLFGLILTISAPPVVENANRKARAQNPNTDSGSDDIVRLNKNKHAH